MYDVTTENKPVVTSIICIPVFWEDVNQIFDLSGGTLMIVGEVLIDTKSGQSYGFELCNYDDRMQQSFEVAGMVTGVSKSFLETVGNHKSVIYLSGQTGEEKPAKALAETVGRLLKIGGIGVKIETSGKAFDFDKWLSFLNRTVGDPLYDMFVLDSLVNTDGSVYSCGMHNLGWPDVIVKGLELQDAVDLIRIFNFYQLVDKPVIKNGQIFRTGIDVSRYIITDEINQPNKGHDLFENPFGMWCLTLAE